MPAKTDIDTGSQSTENSGIAIYVFIIKVKPAFIPFIPDFEIFIHALSLLWETKTKKTVKIA